MKVKPPEIPAFLDGIVTIFRVDDIAELGDRPKRGIHQVVSLRFADRTIGYKRHYTAMQAMEQIDRLVRVPEHPKITTKQIAIINGVQYRINALDVNIYTTPRVMDLTLEKLEDCFDVEQN